MRTARYEYAEPGNPMGNRGPVFKGADAHPVKLLDSSREYRIAALKLFPVLAAELKHDADAALKTIEDAKKLVK